MDPVVVFYILWQSGIKFEKKKKKKRFLNASCEPLTSQFFTKLQWSVRNHDILVLKMQSLYRVFPP